MIAEAAYYLAQKRGFTGENTLDDWLAAEQETRQVISPIVSSADYERQEPKSTQIGR